MINAAQIGEGIVHKAQNSFFYVKLEEEDAIVECKLRGNSKRFRREREIVIGDRVSISLLGSRKGVIERRLPRTRFLKRPMIANITQVVLTFAAAAPDLSKVLLNRFLILAESSKIPKILIAINLISRQRRQRVLRLMKPSDTISLRFQLRQVKALAY